LLENQITVFFKYFANALSERWIEYIYTGADLGVFLWFPETSQAISLSLGILH
jgi:hypothetical protein